MPKYIVLSAFALFLRNAPVLAQLAGANDSGVRIGHVHLFSKDPDLQKKVWVEGFGAQLTKTGTLELLRLPGIFIIINKSESSTGSAGSTVDHFGLSVKDLNDTGVKLRSLGIQLRGSFVEMPDGVQVELIEEKGQTLPVLMHHVHINAQQPERVRQWYVKMFGAEPGSRGNLPAASFHGNAVEFFSSGTAAPSPTKGRAIDHIGFEVNDLAAFMKRLQAEGVTIEAPYRNMPNFDLKVAFITDPIGTRIELTEGLAGK